jgi:hypothetical protein
MRGMSTCRGTAYPTPPVICEQRCELPFIPNVIGMLSHRQNSRALSGRQCPGSGDAQSRERMNFIKIFPVYTIFFWMTSITNNLDVERLFF